MDIITHPTTMPSCVVVPQTLMMVQLMTVAVFDFFYRGPEAAGRTVVTVNWRDPRDEETGSVSRTFENRHDGLVEITGTPAMTLTGHESDDFHLAPDIHWVTSTTKSRIGSLAALYYAEFERKAEGE